MLHKIDISKVLFLDIETVPISPSYDDLNERFKLLWDKKVSNLIKNEDDTPQSFYPRAGIYSEFGKIICISVAYFNNNKLRVKSFYGDDESILLLEFKELLDKYFSDDSHFLCGHNAKEFDFPYIARRMLINKIKIPKILNTAGMKPWEVRHLDTMQLWKFGDYKHYTSLDLLTAIFDIPTPKDDISGADVWKVYWKDNDLERIKIYCEKDTITVVRLFQAFRMEDWIQEENIVFI
ncbi:MAG: 3'-5' exonuclease [Bacteroidales bacterium]|nr:3'-5' exonuclease [Bacteroidales bacterium]